jgi:hypothetical protein
VIKALCQGVAKPSRMPGYFGNASRFLLTFPHEKNGNPSGLPFFHDQLHRRKVGAGRTAKKFIAARLCTYAQSAKANEPMPPSNCRICTGE